MAVVLLSVFSEPKSWPSDICGMARRRLPTTPQKPPGPVQRSEKKARPRPHSWPTSHARSESHGQVQTSCGESMRKAGNSGGSGERSRRRSSARLVT